MSRASVLHKSSVGKKVMMAVTGVILLGFVIAHLIGNLKVYLGAETYNAYAAWLRHVGAPAFSTGEVLWIVRVVLLVSVFVHIRAAQQLSRMSHAARSTGYHESTGSLTFTYASRTMRWGGVILALFVLYHLMHFTWGTLHPDFVKGDVYHNLVSGFQVWWVSAVYIAAMIALGLHIYHGVWSGFQTLGLNNPRYRRMRRPLAAFLALVISLGNISFPVAVLTGMLK